jgi:hypothetical protein
MTHHALEGKPYLDADGEALVAYVSANTWGSPRMTPAVVLRRLVVVWRNRCRITDKAFGALSSAG